MKINKLNNSDQFLTASVFSIVSKIIIHCHCHGIVKRKIFDQDEKNVKFLSQNMIHVDAQHGWLISKFVHSKIS